MLTVWGVDVSTMQAKCSAKELETALFSRAKDDPVYAAKAIFRGCGYVWEPGMPLSKDEAGAVLTAALAPIQMPPGEGMITEPAEVEQALRALLVDGAQRGLTLYPEWAEAVRKLGKTCENRPMRPPSTLPIGSRFAIHAGAGPTSQAAANRTIDAVAKSAMLEGWTVDPWGFSRDGARADFEPVNSAIVATVRLVGVVDPDRLPAQRVSWHIPRSWGWLLGDVQVLPRPIKCPGSQGLWRLARVADEMRAARSKL